MFDVIIRHGTVIDGTGADRRAADVGIRGDRIAEIGNLSNASAAVEIDAAGKIVCPGFIDVHNHSDGWMLKTPHILSKTTQGFTSEILMLDGIGYAPVNEQTVRHWMYYLRSLDALRMDEYRGWRTIAEFMQCIEGNNVQNAATHIPYANVRSLVCGFGRGAADDFQMRSIKTEIRKGMEQGAVGLSTGIDYIVQCFSGTEELVDACSAMAEYDGLYVTHIRYKSGRMRALREAVEIARRAGVRLHISHLKAEDTQAVDEILDFVDKEARHEVDFSFDVYPYQPGSTMLNYLMPYDAWEQGPLAAIGRLNEAAVRTHFREGLKAQRLELDKLTIAWVASSENKHLQGCLMSEYVGRSGLAPEDAIFNLLAEERLAVLLVFNEGDDQLVWPFLQHDLFMLGTDGIYFDDGLVHPRQFGSAGRMLGSCVRDLQLFSLEQAVHKMSGIPAQRFRLKDRGLLAANCFADVVVFDADAITDRANYTGSQQNTVGVEHVLTNGKPILQDGAAVEFATNQYPGRFVKMEQ